MKRNLRAYLESASRRYEMEAFIADDPVAIPHAFHSREDIELSAFMTALLSWGQRGVILRKARELMARMDAAPSAFVRGHSKSERKAFADFVHRTFQGGDAITLLALLQRIYREEGGLETVFTQAWQQEGDMGAAMHRARAVLLRGTPPRFAKHLADPLAGSTAKRLCMFLRWMVRPATGGVDFGLWSGIPTSALCCPLDVHSGRVARALGLLERRQNDWKAVLELTAALRQFDPVDPVRYDFALFGAGVNETASKFT